MHFQVSTVLSTLKTTINKHYIPGLTLFNVMNLDLATIISILMNILDAANPEKASWSDSCGSVD